MRLFYADASPYARKVLVMAKELGVADTIDISKHEASPVAQNQEIATVNPSARIPTLVLDSGQALYDSRVICQYLDGVSGKNLMYPADLNARTEVLVKEAAADGLLDAALLARYESFARPEALRWQDWYDGQMTKIARTLDMMNGYFSAASGLDAAAIASGCAIGYLEFRFPDFDWRSGRPQLCDWYDDFSQRPSMKETKPS